MRIPPMARWLVPFVGVCLWLMSSLAAQAQDCQYVLGFLAIYEQIPDIVGQCRSNEMYDPQGNSNQLTANGLMQWRKADNFTAFTDGYRTWVNGPCGLEQRLNTQRFTWEANPEGLPVVPSACTAAPPAPVPPPTAVGPTATPAPAAFIEFTTDNENVRPGECSTLYWRTENIDQVYLDGKGVVGNGQQEVCPTQTTVYTLEVIHRDGSKSTHEIEINVRS